MSASLARGLFVFPRPRQPLSRRRACNPREARMQSPHPPAFFIFLFGFSPGWGQRGQKAPIDLLLLFLLFLFRWSLLICFRLQHPGGRQLDFSWHLVPGGESHCRASLFVSCFGGDRAPAGFAWLFFFRIESHPRVPLGLVLYVTYSKQPSFEASATPLSPERDWYNIRVSVYF